MSQATGKHILHGIIGIVIVPNLPATIGGFVAYVRLSNVHGAQRVSLSFLNGRTGDPIIETEAEFPSHAEPLGVYTLVAPVPSFVVNEEGRYLFTASHRGVPIAQTPIMVKVLQRKGKS